MNFRAKKKYFKSVKYDRLGACSPEKDCLW